MFWFPAPPVDVAPFVPKLRHSFAYMHYLTKKRKVQEDVMDIDEPVQKRTKKSAAELLNEAIITST